MLAAAYPRWSLPEVSSAYAKIKSELEVVEALRADRVLTMKPVVMANPNKILERAPSAPFRTSGATEAFARPWSPPPSTHVQRSTPPSSGRKKAVYVCDVV